MGTGAGRPNDADARAIAEGRHADPFSVLGLHESAGEWRVTAFMPDAARLIVVTPGGEYAARPWPGIPGMFTSVLPGWSGYRLRAEGAGWAWEYNDPYAFGPVLGEIDEYLLGEGSHQRLWQALGGHLISHEGVEGAHFAVWAPSAGRVSVVGAFNTWDGRRHVMRQRGQTGIWEIFIPGLAERESYKYEIRGQGGAILPLKADPVGFGSEHPPRNASVLRRLPGSHDDGAWPAIRASRNSVDAPVSIYEVHTASWRRTEDGRILSWAELAEQLLGYVEWMGYTHIELLPISEYPFDGSWGYQPIGLFAPTVRHGTPDEFRAFIAEAHRRGIGVILDWVPGHFPTDPHGLGQFDGTALYEHRDPKEGFHQDWNTLIYNYGRAEVSNYLISNALYWLEIYGADGLRVDAVASMLYRDYSREPGQWVPNKDGGRENYEAIAMLRAMNTAVYAHCPWAMTAAEESTSFPGVSRAVDQGGLGFGFKWNMGWMNDSLDYMQLDPVYRQHHHNKMTFASSYAYSENFVLPISHDEVVHGKGSMIGKMPGEGEQKFANLRAFYGFMWGHPGKKLLFMGQDFAQGREWNHDRGLDWEQERIPAHRGVQLWLRDLNRLYRDTPALYRHDTRPEGFRWLLADEAETSVFAWTRFGDAGDAPVVVACNMTPVERRVRLGLPAAGFWRERLNSDAAVYGGLDRGNMGGVIAEKINAQGEGFSALVTLPPLSAVFLEHVIE
ncbi:1,4-alpha-glucan branching protein GlgB [Pseudogemmobacter bohemicus]|uniref:1,4-alpha-glucan branching protein GlgB n=1 Tax=Pseudogemmobacter bohemicus TaxID=2250708 RepID=UPI000DD3A204|nr:1,4-alpha-glucan branching protein GlgB [Pseudogemmobacter bohemicus]